MPLLFLSAPPDVLGRMEKELGGENVCTYSRSETPQWRQEAIEASAENNIDGTAKPVPTVEQLTQVADEALERGDTLLCIKVEGIAIDALATRLQVELNTVN